MYRLLIVDDEPIIVKSLYQLFRDAVRLDLEVYRAYNVYEALDHLHKTRIDLVVTDIRMPGMSGIDLHKQIMASWPRCRVIFLTGYDDFEYARQAIRNGGIVDYLLKNENEDMIVKAMEKAVAEIEKHERAEDYLHKAKEKLQMAIPAMQKNYLFDCMQGSAPPPGMMANKFAQLDIPLHAAKQVYAVIGRVDGWNTGLSETDRTLLIYAIQNIVEEYLSSAAVSVSVVFDTCKFLWLMQPCDSIGNDAPEDEQQWSNLISMVDGIMEAAQETCRRLLKISVSCALSREPCAWERLGAQFHYLKILLGQGLEGEQELLIRDKGMFEPFTESNRRHLYSGSQHLRKQLGLWEEYLESGRREEFLKQYEQLMSSGPLGGQTYMLELFYSVSLCLLSYCNRAGLFHEVSLKMNVGKMTQFDAHDSWDDVVRYFKEFAGLLLDARQNQNQAEARTQRMIHFIHEYIDKHLDQAISLTELSALVNHSPTYLSRLYKRITGVMLFDYITERRMRKAKELLAVTNMKVHEIAATVGYETAPHFTRTFKKAYTMTPQEYRDAFYNPSS